MSISDQLVLTPNRALNSLAHEHRDWLSQFDPGYARNWEKSYKADYEAAITEAAVRRILQEQGVTVEPNESLIGAKRAPDFRCVVARSRFYVEVTNISIAKATKETQITIGWKGGHFGLLTNSVFRQCQKKTPQCAQVDEACLVAIGTFHPDVAIHCFEKRKVALMLTGTAYASIAINMRTGTIAGPLVSKTDCKDSAFLQPDKAKDGGFARNSLSGSGSI